MASFVTALGAEKPDEARLAQLLGDDWRTYIPRGGVQRSDVDTFLAQYRAQHTIARRIGRNELGVLQSLLAYHDAQMDYATEDHNGNGALEYAQKIFSEPGKHDGLYWDEDGDGEVSPLGPLFGQDVVGDDWYGYHFRILDAQGPSAPGGAYSYLIGNQMSRGFAMVAWPARYDDTGVMSFMISHDGQIFEKDLGPQGDRQAKAMKRFDPDDSWKVVDVAAGD